MAIPYIYVNENVPREASLNYSNKIKYLQNPRAALSKIIKIYACMAVLHFKKSSKLTYVIRSLHSPALFKTSYIKELAFASGYETNKNIQFEKVVTHEYKGLYNPMVTTFCIPRGSWPVGGEEVV